MDLGFLGPKYTWSRQFKNDNSIWERLYRSLAMNSWFLKFPGLRVHHLRCDASDYCLLHIIFTGLDIPPKKKLFRFEEMWLFNEGCEVKRLFM